MKEYNKTTIYLAAMLEYDLGDFISKLNFINCYLGDHSYPVSYDNHMYVRLKPEVFNNEYREIMDKARENVNYVTDYDMPNGEIMVVFKLADKYKKDLEWFKKGKYSKISRDYVTQKFKNKESKRYKVLTKEEAYKKYLKEKYVVRDDSLEELDDIPLPEREIFRHNDLRGWS